MLFQRLSAHDVPVHDCDHTGDYGGMNTLYCCLRETLWLKCMYATNGSPAGWPSVDAYYYGSSSSHSIPHVKIPLLCLQVLSIVSLFHATRLHATPVHCGWSHHFRCYNAILLYIYHVDDDFMQVCISSSYEYA